MRVHPLRCTNSEREGTLEDKGGSTEKEKYICSHCDAPGETGGEKSQAIERGVIKADLVLNGRHSKLLKPDKKSRVCLTGFLPCVTIRRLLTELTDYRGLQP
jgi:hypothetical protein